MYRTLGVQGPKVPVICLGTWPLGGGMGVLDKNQVVKTVHASIDAGVTFIDTAESYLSSEESLGEALEGRRNKVFLATKLSGDHSIAHIKKALEQSIKTLKCDYIDLYQIHTWKSEWKIEDTLAELLKYRDQGTIRYIGVSNFSANQISRSNTVAKIQSCQPHYSILFRASKSDPIDHCKENGIGVIVYSPIARGLLTGKYKLGHEFPLDDHRRHHKAFAKEYVSKGVKVANELSRWAKDHGRTGTELAIAWTLATPGVTSAICGAKNPAQALQNAAAGSWLLTKTQLNEIETLIADHCINTPV